MTSLLPGALTTLNCRPYGHHSSHINQAHLAMLHMIVMGDSNTFILQDNLHFFQH